MFDWFEEAIIAFMVGCLVMGAGIGIGLWLLIPWLWKHICWM